MGNAYIPLSALLSALGAEVIIPPLPTKKTVELGSLYAPEFVCLPFKVNLGDNLQALDMGANTLAMVCGAWACRFGYYGRIQHRILRDAGFEFESLFLGRSSIASVYKRFRETSGKCLPLSWAKALRIFYMKAKAVDKLESLSRKIRPFEIKKGSTSRALADGLKILHQARDVRETREAFQKAKNTLLAVETENSHKPLHISIVGEIYVVLEPALNFSLIERLGERGVLVHPALSVYKWLFRSLKIDPFITADEKLAIRRTKPYIPYDIGGEEHQTIGGTIKAAKKGYDGVIHLYPLTCMPENISRTIIPALERKYEIPVLNLCLDEHSSPAGVMTRIEAFLDLLTRKRLKKPLYR